MLNDSRFYRLLKREDSMVSGVFLTISISSIRNIKTGQLLKLPRNLLVPEHILLKYLMKEERRKK